MDWEFQRQRKPTADHDDLLQLTQLLGLLASLRLVSDHKVAYYRVV